MTVTIPDWGWWGAQVVALATTVGSLFGWFPVIAAAVAACFYLIQIWESHTIQHWYRNRRMVIQAKRVAKLKARAKVLAARLEAEEKLRDATREARDTVARVAAESEKEIAEVAVTVEKSKSNPEK